MFENFSKKNVEIFFSYIFFLWAWGFALPALPTGLHPWSSFRLRTLHSGNRFALNGISAKNLNIFFIEIFFHQLFKKFFLKLSESYPKKFSSKSDDIFFLSHFSLSHFKSTISEKLEIPRINQIFPEIPNPFREPGFGQAQRFRGISRHFRDSGEYLVPQIHCNIYTSHARFCICRYLIAGILVFNCIFTCSQDDEL